MKRGTIAIVVLSVLLVGSNVYWASLVFDGAISYTYLQDFYKVRRGAALQALAVLSEVARETATRQSVIDAAVRVQPDATLFEKQGFVWVGDIGLRFDERGRFVEAKPATEPF